MQSGCWPPDGFGARLSAQYVSVGRIRGSSRCWPHEDAVSRKVEEADPCWHRSCRRPPDRPLKVRFVDRVPPKVSPHPILALTAP